MQTTQTDQTPQDQQPPRGQGSEFTRLLGEIAYLAAAKTSGCEQPWGDANQDKWTAAAAAVLEWACEELDGEASMLPCAEDAAVTEGNADWLRRRAGLLPELD